MKKLFLILGVICGLSAGCGSLNEGAQKVPTSEDGVKKSGVSYLGTNLGTNPTPSSTTQPASLTTVSRMLNVSNVSLFESIFGTGFDMDSVQVQMSFAASGGRIEAEAGGELKIAARKNGVWSEIRFSGPRGTLEDLTYVDSYGSIHVLNGRNIKFDCSANRCTDFGVLNRVINQ